ncbi:NAD(P)-dependent alcohol dehydrogenase [Cumulibacter soli]|uniref:NAD(P)-dependent alcohol dehydrogenase n=1 Tax=Cumulibacter soli TaxID=2546344 RepID=UPI0010688BAB|nr:NAD(P)-dependent alcohol dehydrogenase [Cumulibacter soli]
MKTQAAVMRAADGPYAIEEIELPNPGPGELLVRVVGAGMCHTDVVPRAGSDLVGPPIVTGHEGSGVVEAVGPDVTRAQVGDHVCLSFDSCGKCQACADGVPAYCVQFMVRNLSGLTAEGQPVGKDANGADVKARWFGQSSFATYCLATERNAVVVDKALPLEKLGPLGCGVQTGAASIAVAMGFKAGRSLVVFGAGAVGLSALMAAKVLEAKTIIAVDLHPHRLDIARELGATHVIAGDAEDLVAQIHEITGGGADYVFDTTGLPPVQKNAMAALRLGGTAGFVGVQQGDFPMGSESTGKSIMNILEGATDPQVFIPRMIEWWQAGKFPFDSLIETYPMSEINQAEQDSLSGKTIKPILIPGS